MFKNIFKSGGKVFTKIGKGIKKTFKAVGKFTNKLGIVGQIGMMFAAPYLAGWAMTGLKTLGSGFMTGLGTAAKGVGFWGKAASVAQKVFQIVGGVAESGISGARNISKTITGVLGDVVGGIGKAMGLPTTDNTETNFKNIVSGYDPSTVSSEGPPVVPEANKVLPSSYKPPYAGVPFTEDISKSVSGPSSDEEKLKDYWDKWYQNAQEEIDAESAREEEASFLENTVTKTASGVIENVFKSPAEAKYAKTSDNRRRIPVRGDAFKQIAATTIEQVGSGVSLDALPGGDLNAVNSLAGITKHPGFETPYVDAMYAEYKQPMALGVDSNFANSSFA